MKKTIDFELLDQIAKAISNQFGKNCEVTVHDLRKDLEDTIVSIYNGHVTGRKVGDSASEIVVDAVVSKQSTEFTEIEDKYAYFTRTTDGRELKSTSIFIKDEAKNPVAVISINYDISEFRLVENIVKEFAEVTTKETTPDTIPNNVNILLDILIEEAYQLIGKPVNLMTKEDKVKAIKYLEQRGALLIKKSGDKISRFFDISKYTLYGYLSSDSE